MQRDMDLIRKILLGIEESPHGFVGERLNIEGYSTEQIGYHAWLMAEAGLIRAHEVTQHNATSPVAIPLCLTWAGHEFLAESKNEGTWRKGTAAVMAKTGAIGFEILKAVLSAEIRHQLGLP
jgi:hypothetical protein